VSTGWNPQLHTWASYTRTECGIEHLSIRFPWTSYGGMNREQGLNALNFWWTPHSWVDDVEIVNAGACVCGACHVVVVVVCVCVCIWVVLGVFGSLQSARMRHQRAAVRRMRRAPRCACRAHPHARNTRAAGSHQRAQTWASSWMAPPFSPCGT
jgi:hypothetical protein